MLSCRKRGKRLLEDRRIVSGGEGRKHRVVVVTDMDYWGDDANALFMLLRSRQVHIDSIITTSGNVWVEQATVHALDILAKLNREDIPVYRGMSAEYHEDRMRYYRTAEIKQHETIRYAGALGAGYVSLTPRPAETPRHQADPESGVDYLVRAVLRNPREMTLLLIGPATVLAQAMRKEPKVAASIKHLYMMGGAIAADGNSTPYAEFNFWFDPESARAVLSSAIPTTIVTLDSTQGTGLDSAVAQRLVGRGQIMASHVAEYLRRENLRRPGRLAPMWDEAAAGVLLEPSIVREDRNAPLSVSTERGMFYGASTLESRCPEGERGSVRVVLRLDGESLRTLFCDLLDGS